VLAGFLRSDEVEPAGAVLVSAGVGAVCGVLWFAVRPACSDRRSRTLLAVTTLVPVPSMLLALSWAYGEAVDAPHPSLTWMLATHGVANAFGFALGGVLAWHRLAGHRVAGHRMVGYPVVGYQVVEWLSPVESRPGVEEAR